MPYKPAFYSSLAVILVSGSLALAAPGAPGHSHGSSPVGQPGDPKKPARIINVTMKETEDGKMLFMPEKVAVRKGEQVKFVLKNAGAIDHEFVLDTVANNAKHKIEMEKNPDMEHDDPNAKRLKPKATGEILWQFTKAGTFDFSCLIPGHRQSGMFGTIVVE